VFEQVCLAVAYAHREGFIHRDLKPSNAMVGAFGEVQVMEWGLAKVLGEASRPRQPAKGGETEYRQPTIVLGRSSGVSSATRAGSMLGTPAYMPPEQARGEADCTDRRSDVFALGAVLCEILTGRPPYSGAFTEVVAAAREGHPDEAVQRLDGCGADAKLVALAKRCLARRPEDRPVDASAVAAAVRSCRTQAVQQVRRKAEGAAQLGRELRHLMVAIGILAAVAAGAAGLYWLVALVILLTR
jgi:serine/threonine-protein kinase